MVCLRPGSEHRHRAVQSAGDLCDDRRGESRGRIGSGGVVQVERRRRALTLRTRIPGVAGPQGDTSATADPRPLGRIGGGDLPPIVVDPKNENVILQRLDRDVAQRRRRRQLVGGARLAGGDDYQRIWIHPDDPNLILAVSDQGAVISSNRGASWSNWYTQPTPPSIM